MALSFYPFYPASLSTGKIILTNGMGTAIQDFITAGANGVVIKNIQATSTDTVQVYVKLWRRISSVDYLLGAQPVQQRAGDGTGAAAVDMLNPTYYPALDVDANGKRILRLQASEILRVSAVSTIASTKEIHITAEVLPY